MMDGALLRTRLAGLVVDDHDDEIEDRIAQLEEKLQYLQNDVSALASEVNTGQQAREPPRHDSRLKTVERRVSQLVARIQQLESAAGTDPVELWADQDTLDVDTAATLVDALGGVTDTRTLHDAAQQHISDGIPLQAVTACMVSGKKTGAMDYDTGKEPTRVWTAGHEP